MPEKEKNYHLINLGEESQLKIDLNEGVASLQMAIESHFQPHVCLNGKEGVGVIERIYRDPKGTNTEFWIRELLIKGGEDLWLNIHFMVFLDQICFPNNVAVLSPRQTSYIVRNLPVESQKIVMETVKAWYFEKFLEGMKKGIETITEQFNKGDSLVESDDGNRIFDIHGGRSTEVPYTEWQIVGENLFPPFFFGFTCLDHGQDGYVKVDDFLAEVASQRKSTVEGLIGLMREIG